MKVKASSTPARSPEFSRHGLQIAEIDSPLDKRREDVKYHVMDCVVRDQAGRPSGLKKGS
jgi:hypothetical protein